MQRRDFIKNSAIAAGGSGMGFGCAQSVEIKIPDGCSFWKSSQNYGNHMAFVYGDHAAQFEDLGDMMGFEVENIC